MTPRSFENFIDLIIIIHHVHQCLQPEPVDTVGSIGLPDGNGGTKKLRKCGRCYRIRYCNREHQKADHQRHTSQIA